MKDVVRTSPERRVPPNGRNPRPPVRHRRKRKRNMSLYYILVVIFVIIAVIVLSRTLFFSIENFSVTGLTMYDESQMLEAVSLNKGDNLFKLDIKDIEKKLSTLMVYADEVKVRRKLPSTLMISVTEAKPKYNLEHDGKYCLVSESGKILEAGLSQPQEGLINITGFEIKNAVVNVKLESSDSLKARILSDISKNLESMKLEGVGKIDLTDRTDIKIFYKNRIEITLGSSYDLNYKLNYTKAVLESIEKTYGDTYEGKLIYHSASSGMSAIATDGTTQDITNGGDDNSNPDSDSIDDSE